jgi:hypothetical protein
MLRRFRLLIAGFVFFAALLSYSNVWAQSGPDAETEPSEVASSGMIPFLHLIPTEDGREILVSVGFGQEPSGVLYANVAVGDASHKEGWSSHKEGWTMTYSDTVQSYVTTVPGFAPALSQEGRISITSTTGLATAGIEFARAYLTNDGPQAVRSPDGNLEVQFPGAEIFPAATYLAVAPSYRPPAPPPAGLELVGGVYSIRAAGALNRSEKPFVVRLYYVDGLLDGRDPAALGVYVWDGAASSWAPLGGRHFAGHGYLSAATDRLGTYALMAATEAGEPEFSSAAWLKQAVDWWQALVKWMDGNGFAREEKPVRFWSPGHDYHDSE